MLPLQKMDCLGTSLRTPTMQSTRLKSSSVNSMRIKWGDQLPLVPIPLSSIHSALSHSMPVCPLPSPHLLWCKIWICRWRIKMNPVRWWILAMRKEGQMEKKRGWHHLGVRSDRVQSLPQHSEQNLFQHFLMGVHGVRLLSWLMLEECWQHLQSLVLHLTIAST